MMPVRSSLGQTEKFFNPCDLLISESDVSGVAFAHVWARSGRWLAVHSRGQVVLILRKEMSCELEERAPLLTGCGADKAAVVCFAG